MTDLHLMLLSALQGLTEFLPVSSSGHLILFSKFTTFPDQGLAFDVAVHVGSIIAVMIYFSETIWEMLKGVAKTYFIPNFKNPGSKLAWLIVIGTIPAVIAGLFLVENGTDELRSARLIGWTMLSFGIVLFIADKIGMTIRKIEHLTALDAVPGAYSRHQPLRHNHHDGTFPRVRTPGSRQICHAAVNPHNCRRRRLSRLGTLPARQYG